MPRQPTVQVVASPITKHLVYCLLCKIAVMYLQKRGCSLSECACQRYSTFVTRFRPGHAHSDWRVDLRPDTSCETNPSTTQEDVLDCCFAEHQFDPSQGNLNLE